MAFIRSYSTQRNRNRLENLVINLKVVLPDNISTSVKEEIYALMIKTDFAKLPINITCTRRNLGFREYNIHEKYKEGFMIPIGFVRSFDFEKKEMTVMVFGNLAKSVREMNNPSIEVVFAESEDHHLVNITRFNLINLRTDYDRSNNNSNRSVVHEDSRSTDSNNSVRNEQRQQYHDNDNRVIHSDSDNGITLGEAMPDSIKEQFNVE